MTCEAFLAFCVPWPATYPANLILEQHLSSSPWRQSMKELLARQEKDYPATFQTLLTTLKPLMSLNNQ